MMQAKRGRSVKLEKVHERMTKDAPVNAVLGTKVVDDPYEPGAKLRVVTNLRDDPLAGMRSRDQIDDAQEAAGRKWQRLFEEASIGGGVRAIDPTKEAVDGGRFPEPITDRQIRAFRELAIADRELGQEGSAIIRQVLHERLSIREIAFRRGMTSQLEVRYVGRRFRECLETLAVLWNFAPTGLTVTANQYKGR